MVINRIMCGFSTLGQLVPEVDGLPIIFTTAELPCLVTTSTRTTCQLLSVATVCR